MGILKYFETNAEVLSDRIKRRLIHLNNIMTVVIDFKKGPWNEPLSHHHHIHEQTTYIAHGEIMFFMEGEEPVHLKQGDMFYVPSGKKHTVQLLSETARLIDSFNPIRKDFL